MSINTSMMQNFGLEDLLHVQSRRNLLNILGSSGNWLQIGLRGLAEQISSKIEIWRAH